MPEVKNICGCCNELKDEDLYPMVDADENLIHICEECKEKLARADEEPLHQWEYKVVASSGEMSISDFAQELSALGRAGWELVAYDERMFKGVGLVDVLIFKREV